LMLTRMAPNPALANWNQRSTRRTWGKISDAAVALLDYRYRQTPSADHPVGPSNRDRRTSANPRNETSASTSGWRAPPSTERADLGSRPMVVPVAAAAVTTVVNRPMRPPPPKHLSRNRPRRSPLQAVTKSPWAGSWVRGPLLAPPFSRLASTYTV